MDTEFPDIESFLTFNPLPFEEVDPVRTTEPLLPTTEPFLDGPDTIVLVYTSFEGTGTVFVSVSVSSSSLPSGLITLGTNFLEG